jgi:hypothetical protein
MIALYITIIATVIGLIVWLIVRKKSTVQTKDTNVISLNPLDWSFVYGIETPAHPDQNGSGWAFDMPIAPAVISYLKSPARLTTIPKTISLTFRVESTNPVYNAAIYSKTNNSTDANPATFHLFLERNGDDLTKEFYRWWGDTRYEFGSNDNQTLNIEIPLMSDHWTDVLGNKDSNEFLATLNDLAYVGLTFGGNNFAGHGNQLTSGTARFVLLDYKFIY